MTQNQYSEEELLCRRYAHARILPNHPKNLGGVCKQDGSFIESSAIHEEWYDGSYPYEESSVVKEHKDAIFLGTWHFIYGHAITDTIKKFWFLFSQEYKDLVASHNAAGQELDLVFTFIGGPVIPGFIKEILATLGIDFNKLKYIQKVTEYENVYIPDNSIIYRKPVRYYTHEYKDLISRICEHCKTDKSYPEKIYLTRTGIKGGKDFGREEDIEDAFRKKGFVVISPENFSFAEQVAMMQGCKELAATECSVSHNAVFCKKGTSVILLQKMAKQNTYQLMINDLNDLKVTYIRAHHSIPIRPVVLGPFFLWKTKEVNEYLGMGRYEKSRWLSLCWYQYVAIFYWRKYKPVLKKMKNRLLGRNA